MAPNINHKIKEEQKTVSNPDVADIVPYTLDELYGILSSPDSHSGSIY